MHYFKSILSIVFISLLAFACGNPHSDLEELGITVVSDERGSGSEIKAGDFVQFHFSLSLDDGSLVGSSRDAGTPQTTKMGGGELPFEGWELSMMGMQAGGSRTVIIPPSLAFGEDGIEGVIPGDTPLTLELEILDIVEEPTAWNYSPDDVQTTDSGLGFVIHEEGTGEKLGERTRARVDYSIYLEDGTMAFSTIIGGQPDNYQTGVDDFIDGFNEAVPDMREGERRTLLIPSNLAFGDQGASNVIPPGSDLIMDVEVVGIDSEPTPWGYDEANVQSTDTGLQYVVQEEGTGAQPQTGDNIVVHYSGYLEDGTMFDSSVMRDQTFDFTVGMGQVIRGWDEGLLAMQEGERRTLIIPYNLAYGEQGRPPTIPPRATLIFDVELIEVK